MTPEEAIEKFDEFSPRKSSILDQDLLPNQAASRVWYAVEKLRFDDVPPYRAILEYVEGLRTFADLEVGEHFSPTSSPPGKMGGQCRYVKFGESVALWVETDGTCWGDKPGDYCRRKVDPEQKVEVIE